MPLLSIITINLNNKEGLEKTVCSIISQTYHDFEYIVIDGDSTDGSKDILQKYDKNIAFSISEKDTGIYNAMNKGIKRACGDYCLFINSGDVLFNNETISNVFNTRREQDILYGNMIIDFMNGTKRQVKMPANLTVKHMIRDTLWHPVSFIKSKLFEKIGLFDEQYKIAADYDFFLKAVVVDKVSVFYLDQTIVVFSLDGISSQPSNQGLLTEERNKIQSKYFRREEIDNFMKIGATEKIIKKLKSWTR